MAFTVQQLIDQVKAGGGVSASAAAAVTVQMARDVFTTINTTPIDLGQYFTGRQIMECYEFRANVIAGIITTSAGATSISLV